MPPQSGDRDEMHRAIVAELASVVERVRTSLTRIEQAVACEAANEEPVADNVVVLDDVTPGYARAEAVLRECDAGLGIALRLLTSHDAAGEAGLTPARWPISV
jgi:hypothetical protein